MAELRIAGRLSAETFERWSKTQEERGFTGNGKDAHYIEWLLDNCEVDESLRITPNQVLDCLQYSEKERQEINQALDAGFTSLANLLRIGLLAEARRSNKHAERLDNVDVTDTASRSRLRGGGYAYVATVVQQWMEDNLKATRPEEKRYITREQVFKETGTKRANINAYFDDHAEALEAHHKAMGFENENQGTMHNRRLAIVRRWGTKE